jgi:chromosome segregation ATPase
MTAMPKDLTVKILSEIRDEVRKTNERLDVLSTRVDRTNDRIDATNERLDELNRRVVESEIRTSTAITELAGTVRDMTAFLRQQAELRPRVERCELAIADLQRKVG